MSDIAFYKKNLPDIPIVAEDFLEPFLQQRKGKLWTYSCCAQDKLVPNVFTSMPSMRARILGILLYQNQIDGFLRWGFNFWHSQFSKAPIDPYHVTDSGLGFPSGDGFLVYPPHDSQQPYPFASLRLKLLREAFEDKRMLETAEQYLGRDTVMDLLQSSLGQIDFSHYSCDSSSFLTLRNKLHTLLKNKLGENK